MAKKSKNRRNVGKTMVNVAKMLPTPVDAVKTITDMTPVGDVKYGYDLATGREKFDPLWSSLFFIPYLGDGVKGVRKMVREIPKGGWKTFDVRDLSDMGDFKQNQYQYLRNKVAPEHKAFDPVAKLEAAEAKEKEIVTRINELENLKGIYTGSRASEYNDKMQKLTDELVKARGEKVNATLNAIDHENPNSTFASFNDILKNNPELVDDTKRALERRPFPYEFDIGIDKDRFGYTRPKNEQDYLNQVKQNLDRIDNAFVGGEEGLNMAFRPVDMYKGEQGFVYTINRAMNESGAEPKEFFESLIKQYDELLTNPNLSDIERSNLASERSTVDDILYQIEEFDY